MRKFALAAAILLAGCANTHVSQLSSAPSDPARFESDLALCRAAADNRWAVAQKRYRGHAVAGAAFGLLGALATMPPCDPNDDYFKSLPQMTDECMIEKGYPVSARYKGC